MRDRGAPWGGTLHENVAIKSFWTVISVLVLVMVGAAYIRYRRRKGTVVSSRP